MGTSLRALVLLCPLLAFAGDDTPGWLREIVDQKLPDYGPKVNSVVLLNEEHTTVSDSGKLTTTTHTAIKIMARTGSDLAFFEQYDTRGGKVRDFRAWMIPPSGKVKKYGKDEILDVACAENDIYNECRRRLVSGKRDAEAGAIFAYEATVERQIFSRQLMFHFQDSSPVRIARFVVTLPAGWELKTSSFNGAPPEASPANGSYTWQMADLPPIEREPHSPAFLTIVPWVGVNVLGPGMRPVLSWTEAAQLLTELNDGQAEPSEALTAKAKSLVQGAATDLDKIRAIGRFTQQLNYVSIQVNVATGGGYRPHPAGQVFEKLYGDCKDKANLTRAMLKAVGIAAYPVAIYSGDRTHVNRQWPSLGAFNHAISAIKVGPDTRAPAVLEHPALGRLLFFDPTDPYTPAGYLPEQEQASLALIGAGPAGDLVLAPAAPPASGTRVLEIEAVLKPDGSISGSFSQKLTGESLAESASLFRANSKADYAKLIERWVVRSMPGGSANSIEASDQTAEFQLKGQFAALRFAQMPQASMLIFRAAPLRHGDSVRLTAKARKYPVVIASDALDEKVRIILPDGFKIDEIPEPIHLSTAFGKYEAKWESNLGALVFSRKIELQAQSVPAAQYGELRRFLEVVYGSAETPVVLVKQ